MDRLPLAWLLTIGLLAEVLLLASLALSISRPRLRLWPPPAGGSFAFAWSWGLTVVACTSGLLLAILDYGGWILDDRRWILAGTIPLAIGSGLADWGVRSLGQLTSSGRGGEFSARGPYPVVPSWIKPDVTAPGVSILAASTPVPNDGSPGQPFKYLQGTSMASPHVAGIAALLREAHPDWSPAAIKSALMTTARTNLKKEDGVTRANPFDYGNGHIVPNKAVDPGLYARLEAVCILADGDVRPVFLPKSLS